MELSIFGAFYPTPPIKKNKKERKQRFLKKIALHYIKSKLPEATRFIVVAIFI